MCVYVIPMPIQGRVFVCMPHPIAGPGQVLSIEAALLVVVACMRAFCVSVHVCECECACLCVMLCVLNGLAHGSLPRKSTP